MKQFPFYLLLSLFLLFLSCNKNEETCESVIENNGIIESSVNFPCDEPFYIGNFVIDSDEDLDSVMNLDIACTRPDIDFTQYTMLGKYAWTEDKGSYYRNVEIDSTNLEYDFTITVKTCGECNCLSQNMNWVLVPKLPEGWSVEFKLKLP